MDNACCNELIYLKCSLCLTNGNGNLRRVFYETGIDNPSANSAIRLMKNQPGVRHCYLLKTNSGKKTNVSCCDGHFLLVCSGLRCLVNRVVVTTEKC